MYSMITKVFCNFKNVNEINNIHSNEINNICSINDVTITKQTALYFGGNQLNLSMNFLLLLAKPEVNFIHRKCRKNNFVHELLCLLIFGNAKSQFYSEYMQKEEKKLFYLIFELKQDYNSPRTFTKLHRIFSYFSSIQARR